MGNYFLTGGSKLSEDIAVMDWINNPLGSLENWPSSLKISFGICLNSLLPMSICWGPQMILLYNKPYTEFLNGKDPCQGKSAKEVWPEIWETIGPLLENVKSSGKSLWLKDQLFRLTKNGRIEDRYFSFSYSPIKDEEGIMGVLAIVYETTEKVLNEHRIQAAEELALKVEQQAKTFDITLTAIKDFIYTFDIEGRFTYSNKPLLELLGISLDQIIGKNFYELPYPQELADVLQSQIAQVIETGKSTIDETFYTNPQGKSGYYEYIFTPIFDKEGKVILVAGSTRDISERKKSEKAIREFNEELISVNKELTTVNADLDSFIYTASHDLKAPISNIEGLTIALKNQLLKESLENPIINQLLKMIQGSIDSFNKTVQSLTDITKLQRIIEDQETKIYLDEIIGEIKLDLSRTIHETKAIINLEGDSGKFLKFSPKNLRSVFFNLISNSLKYRSPDRNPVIRIYFENDPDYDVVNVEDNGLGMDLSQEKSIFEMFKRLHNHVEGTGIGLYIVKKIIDNANGKVEVKSTVGKGSVFKLFFDKSHNRYEKA